VDVVIVDRELARTAALRAAAAAEGGVKDDGGLVIVIGGSRAYPAPPYLAGLAARRTGVHGVRVPVHLREASAALGVSRARTIVSVVLPTAGPGIITGVFLAVARAMGETAPLLLTALGDQQFMQLHPTQRMSTLSLQIFTDAISGFQAAQARAWAGALTLIIIVLLFAVSARLISRRATTTRS
jgi:ABC-type molybdate transport system permease subunit